MNKAHLPEPRGARCSQRELEAIQDAQERLKAARARASRFDADAMKTITFGEAVVERALEIFFDRLGGRS